MRCAPGPAVAGRRTCAHSTWRWRAWVSGSSRTASWRAPCWPFAVSRSTATFATSSARTGIRCRRSATRRERWSLVVTFLRADSRIPHRRVLPHAFVVPVLARFFHRFPTPSSRSRVLLRRWIWRGAAIGVQGDGFTPALRLAVSAIQDDEHDAVQRLLNQVVDAEPPPLDLRSTRLTEAVARANLALLASLGPRSLTSGEPIEVASLLDRDEPLAQLGSPGVARSLAHVFINPDLDDLEGALASPIPSCWHRTQCRRRPPQPSGRATSSPSSGCGSGISASA